MACCRPTPPSRRGTRAGRWSTPPPRSSAWTRPPPRPARRRGELGFAIPANRVLAIAGEIEAHTDLPGLVYGRQAFLGVEVVDSSAASGMNFGFGFGLNPIASTPNGTPGVVIAAVHPGSAAATAGLVSGDVITAIDRQATATTSALSKAIEAKKPVKS